MDSSLSGLRHAARGCLNSIKLCASAFDLPGPLEEQVQFLDDIIIASDKMCALVDQLSSAFDHAAAAPAAAHALPNA